MNRVVITGLGCVSALGVGVDETWKRMIEGPSGIRNATIGAQGKSELSWTGSAAIAPDVVAKLVMQFGRKPINTMERVANLGAAATLEAIGDAGLPLGGGMLNTAAIVYGSASGGNASIEAGYERLFAENETFIHPLTIPRYMASATASHLSMLFGVRGICFGLASACASSAHALSEGMHMIRAGRAEIVIAGGSDASLTYGSLWGWEALQAMSHDPCRPFSSGRAGTTIGEGAATLVLESEAHARARGARIYAELAGSGATSDASHITKPNSTGAVEALLSAHGDAGLSVSEPILYSAHGTGTVLNDRSEASALRQVYGENLVRNRVIATKSCHGHTLGAAGAIELLIAVLALRNRLAPPTLNYLGPDPDCDIPLVLSPESIAYRATVSASFGFGGLNCVLVARLPD